MASGKAWLTFLYNYRKVFILVFTPLLLIPLLTEVENEPQGRCGYMLILMAVYWITEAMPVPVTGLLPIFLAPMLGLLTGAQVASNYMKNVVVLLVGGIFVAVAIERTNLHRRLALGAILLVGTRPHHLLLGFMIPTFLCSMFISNTATTAMMLPIAEAVLQQIAPKQKHEDKTDEKSADTDVDADADADADAPDIKNTTNKSDDNLINMAFESDEKKGSSDATNDTQSGDTAPPAESSDSPSDASIMNMRKALTLSICFTANVGGTATLTGTPPNLILKGFADELWADNDLGESPVNYSSWIAFAFPVALLNFVCIYVWLVLFYLGFRSFKCKKHQHTQNEVALKSMIQGKYQALGKVTYPEVTVAVLFFLLVFLWFFRAPGFMDGWSIVFQDGFISDSVAAFLIAFLLFGIPMRLMLPSNDAQKETVPPILGWNDVNEKFPWGIIFLIGGGFCIAQSATITGLSVAIGKKLSVFADLPGFVMICIICFLVAMVTEVTSNSATCTMLMPIMASLAIETLDRNPLYLMIPAAIACSYAFMLPIATPPNAIVFATGHLEMMDMIKGGAILNFLCVFGVALATETWGNPLFDFDEIPWANNTRAAAAAAAFTNDTMSALNSTVSP